MLAAGFVLLMTACGAIPSNEPDCDGVAAELGGCERNQPSFDATTCEAVAEAFGRQLDIRALAVIDGPEVIDGQGQRPRMLRAMNLVVARVDQHLRSEGMIDDCRDPIAFVAAAEPAFSERLREKAGDYLFEGASVTYQVWRDELVRMLGILAD